MLIDDVGNFGEIKCVWS